MTDISPDLLLDNLCVSEKHPWSIIELSTTNAQLAGLFAGFMVISLTTIISKEWDGQSASSPDSGAAQRRVTHILMFLSLGIIILVLDAYLFGSVRATRPPASGSFPQAPTNSVGNPGSISPPVDHLASYDLTRSAQQICEYAWVKFMPAAGLLALGAAILGTGLAWMLARFAMDSNVESQKWLTALGNVLAGSILSGTVVLLVYDSTVFIEEMRFEFARIDDAAMVTALAFTWTFGAILLVAAILVVAARIIDLRRQHTDSLAMEDFQLSTLRIPAVLTGMYLFCAVGISGLASMSSTLAVNDWTSPYTRMWLSVILCLAFPGTIYFFIMRLMPGSSGRRKCRRSGTGRNRQSSGTPAL